MIRKKNLSTSSPYSPLPSKAENNVESHFEEASFENATGIEEINDVPPIDVHHPPWPITITLVPTFEWWGYPNIQQTCHGGLSRLRTRKTKRNLYLDRHLITTVMAEFPRFEEQFGKYGFEWITQSPDRYSPALVQEFYAA